MKWIIGIFFLSLYILIIFYVPILASIIALVTMINIVKKHNECKHEWGNWERWRIPHQIRYCKKCNKGQTKGL